MNFKSVYYDKRKQQLNIPIHMDLVHEIKEDGTIIMGIPNEYFPDIVNHGVVKIIQDGKRFNNLDEAVDYQDKMLSEGRLIQKGNKILLEKKTDQSTQILKTNKVKWLDRHGIERSFEVIGANAKIGSDTIVINMSTARSCVSAVLGLCPLYDGKSNKGECYALVMELGKHGPEIIAKTQRVAQEWSCMTPQGLADGIKAIIDANKGIKYVRFNEAGDFRDRPTDPKLLKKYIERYGKVRELDDVGKVGQVAKLLPSIKFYTYTRRSDLKKWKGLPDNVVIQGSGFKIHNTFMPLPLEEYLEVKRKNDAGEHIDRLYGVNIGKKKIRYCMGNCATCKFCKVREDLFIILPIHGQTTSVGKKKNEWKNTILKSPKFYSILRSDKSNKDKTKEIFKFLDVENQKMLTDVIVSGLERQEYFDKIMDNEKLKLDFLDLLYPFSPDFINNLADKTPTEKMKAEGIMASIESLKGKYQAKIKEHGARKGKETSVQAYEARLKSLNKAIDSVKSGGKLIPASHDVSKKGYNTIIKMLDKLNDKITKQNLKDQENEEKAKWKEEIDKLKYEIKQLPKNDHNRILYQSRLDNLLNLKKQKKKQKDQEDSRTDLGL